MYTVIEMQTTGKVTSVIATDFEEKPVALQKYFQCLSYAAVSSVPVHTVVLLNPIGNIEKRDFFERPQMNPETGKEEVIHYD